ncbi:cache domain-containing protein [candidate division KSB1 bacterium]|nr:cache domain-containing protein [candidate division KSB1 bacterium]
MLGILTSLSLRTKLIIVYVFILGAGGLITSFIGSLIVNDTIMNQAKSKVHHDLMTAYNVYDNQLSQIRNSIYIGASGRTIQACMKSDNRDMLRTRLQQIRNDVELDFLTVTDKEGKVFFRVSNNENNGDDVSSIQVIKAALQGRVAAATEIMSNEMLANEYEDLAEKAYLKILDTPMAKPTNKMEETSGMVLIAASPIFDENGEVMGTLYGGHLLNQDFTIVDRVWDLVYKGEQYKNRNIGAVTIFLWDLRISTNVRTRNGRRALGTRLSEDVFETVLVQGGHWSDRAFVVNDWYISEYYPIKNYSGEVIGMLHVGTLEKAYLAIRNRVILTFMGVATSGFLLIVLISYLITKTITRPLEEMVTVTQSIATGDLNQKVKIRTRDEIGKLGSSINIMVKSLNRMRAELEDWGKTLELKVRKRTDELRDMQAKVMQTERLASLGKMAAGIAHEVNNPLGGILVLSSLVLENLKDQDPNRTNLEEVVKQTIRCRDIVKGLLQFSRETIPKMSMININIILNNTLSLIEKQSIFHNIDIEKELDENLPLVMADDSQLQQVFMNILLNAAQAMREIGSLVLTSYFNSKDNMATITIQDTGQGIPEDIIDKIFDPFFTTKDVGEGTGLGLSIAYGIITKHNGKMSVHSELNKGTTFTIEIPVPENSTKQIS